MVAVKLEPAAHALVEFRREGVARNRPQRAEVVSRVKVVDPLLRARLAERPGSIRALPPGRIPRRRQRRLEKPPFPRQRVDTAEERSPEEVRVVDVEPQRRLRITEPGGPAVVPVE